MVHSKFKIFQAKMMVYRVLFGRWDRVKKYFWFIAGLQVYKALTYILLDPVKGRLLETFYLVHRYIDDVVDGDAQSHWTTRERLEYVRRMREFTLGSVPAREPIELLIRCYQDLAGRRHEDYGPETLDILDSLIFDARRFGTNKVFKRKELEEHYHQLDERGTVSPMLYLFGENPDRFSDLSPLARAVRICYNLRDLKQDLARGLINIPSDDIHRYRLDLSSSGLRADSFKIWLKDQAELGLGLLDTHRYILERRRFRFFTRFVLWQVYERKTSSYLRSIAADPARLDLSYGLS